MSQENKMMLIIFLLFMLIVASGVYLFVMMMGWVLDKLFGRKE